MPMENRITMFATNESYQRLFLRGYPVKDLLIYIMTSLQRENSEECQKEVLQKTVDLPLVKKYPLKIQYMRSFLKSFISELEMEGMVVCDELYQTYCELLKSPDEKDTHYRHFMLDDTIQNSVTVQESISMISNGTTGLYTWQASQLLIKWCTAHQEMLHGKNVLELGSGVGLAGLAISLICQPQNYCFSDCHPAVLKLLKSNVEINVNRQRVQLGGEALCPAQEVEENILYHGILKNSKVHVMHLAWENVPQHGVEKYLSPDIVLAADVVYDGYATKALCEALCYFIKNSHRIGVLACTVRNEDTIKEFLDILEKRDLHIEEEYISDYPILLYSQETPIRVYKIKSQNT